MNITCPHCGISGNVDEEKLRASSGRLRCPGCRENFTVPLSQTGSVPPGAVSADDDIAVTDDIHAAHADAIEAAMSESIGNVVTEDRADDIDDLLSDQDIEDFPDIPDDLGFVDEALDEFGVPEHSENAAAVSDSSIISDESAAEQGPAADVPPGITDTELLEDEPLILEEVIEDDRGKTVKKNGRPRRKFFSMPSLPAGAHILQRLSPFRTMLSLVLLAIILGATGILGLTRFYLPFTAEKAFIEDSRAMFEEYRRLQVFLDVGVSDSFYIASVAETAYLLIVYRDEYGSDRSHAPLYAAVSITGALFLATDAFIDRLEEPDIYAGREWGADLPNASRDEYTMSLLEEMSRCFFQIDENIIFLSDSFDAFDQVTFVSFFLDRQRFLDRSTATKKLTSIHKDFISTPSEFPFFADIISGNKKDLSGLR
jgi:predicted Zn finger-like uncharacterized protein